MSGQDVKPKWGSTVPKARFSGGLGLKFGSSPKPPQKLVGPTLGLEDVVFEGNQSPSKMLLQYRTNMDKIANHVGANFGGMGGPQAATAIRKRTEPVGTEPAAPTGIDAAPGSVEMIKWKSKWEDYQKKNKKWTDEVSPRLYNLLIAHCTEELRGVLQGRPGWDNILETQNGVDLVKMLHALHHQQDDSKPEMWEIVQQDRAMPLCAQKPYQSDAAYARALQSTADAINEAGGMAGLTLHATRLVCIKRQVVWSRSQTTSPVRF